MEHVARMIACKAGCPVALNEPLSRHTSFRIGGPADFFVQPGTPAELAGVLAILRDEGIPFFILGNGTNLLASDRGYRGAVIRLEGGFNNYHFSRTMLEAGAAVPLATLAKEACGRGLGGLEFASGIPGTLGGALVMNAGAHGSSLCRVVENADILGHDLVLHTKTKNEMGLSYRKSELPAGAIVCVVRLRLEPGERAVLEERRKKYLAFRRERQPCQPNAGSIFKNPPNDAAGRLLEAAGLKGFRVGGAIISDVHANFIVNTGNATASDVLELIDKAQASVAEKFGVTLELEIKLLG